MLELDRVLDASPDELDRHRLGLRSARHNRLELIARATEGLLVRMDAAAGTANAKVLVHAADSRAEVRFGTPVGPVLHTQFMANWSPLRELLADSTDVRTIAWSDLDDLVGGLPRSAYEHSAFWMGDRSAWRGFTTTDVRVGTSVTFVRREHEATTYAALSPPQPRERPDDPRTPDLVLVGCVKRKVPHPAPAKDLYDSALFRKERAFAEASGAPWFVLSAEHGLVDPSTVLEPYDLRLSKTSRDYRRACGNRVFDQIAKDYGNVDGCLIEIHAGAAYADSIRDGLTAAGASVREPLRGLALGQRLAWYGVGTPSAPAERAPAPAPDIADFVERLGSDRDAIKPAALLASNGEGLRHPGLYSWWVDAAGATDLGRGLGEPVHAGLIYAGLAGATRRRSGRKSTNTLWGRIRGMHIGGRHQFSTFRLSLGSVLASASDAQEIDEAALTAWMHRHLRIVTVVVDDADALDALETGVLTALDPPLNLDKMSKSSIRLRLTALRRQYGTRSDKLSPGATHRPG